MSQRINSKLVYEMLHKALPDYSHKQIFELLKIYDQNNIYGQFQSGMTKWGKNCYWLTDDSWFNQMGGAPDFDKRTSGTDGQLKQSEFTRHTCSVVLKVYSSNEYENKPAKAIRDILGICKESNLPREQMRYLSGKGRKLKEIIDYIVLECEKSRHQPQQVEDRRGLTLETLCSFLEGYELKGIGMIRFRSETEFLAALLSQDCLREACLAQADAKSLMTGDVGAEMRAELCELLMFDGGCRLRRMADACSALAARMAGQNRLHEACLTLIDSCCAETDMALRLKDCISACTDAGHAYRALQVLALYALLGEEQFSRLLPDRNTAESRLVL